MPPSLELLVYLLIYSFNQASIYSESVIGINSIHYLHKQNYSHVNAHEDQMTFLIG